MHVKETETDRKNIGRSHEYYFILVGNIKKKVKRHSQDQGCIILKWSLKKVAYDSRKQFLKSCNYIIRVLLFVLLFLVTF